MQSRKVYAPQADVPATSSGCRLLDRDTFVLDNDAGGGEGDEDEFLSLFGDRVTRDDVAAWSFTSKSPWNRTRRDVGVGGSVWLTTRVDNVVGDAVVSSTIPGIAAATTPVDVDVDADADAPDDGRGGGGNSGILDAWVGAQFWTHLNGSRSLACISLRTEDSWRLIRLHSTLVIYIYIWQNLYYTNLYIIYYVVARVRWHLTGQLNSEKNGWLSGRQVEHRLHTDNPSYTCLTVRPLV